MSEFVDHVHYYAHYSVIESLICRYIRYVHNCVSLFDHAKTTRSKDMNLYRYFIHNDQLGRKTVQKKVFKFVCLGIFFRDKNQYLILGLSQRIMLNEIKYTFLYCNNNNGYLALFIVIISPFLLLPVTIWPWLMKVMWKMISL